jgi:hypothetical protein
VKVQELVSVCEHRRPLVIILAQEDFANVYAFAQTTHGRSIDWRVEPQLSYRGVPIVRSEFYRSYIVEDTPETPTISLIG